MRDTETPMKNDPPPLPNLPRRPDFEPSGDLIPDITRAAEEMGDDFPKFAVFVVAYNAATTLESTLERIPREIYDILECVYVIDDFSDDDTYDIGHMIAKGRRWEKLRVFKNPRNYGYGGNQKIGYRYAVEEGFDYVILLHGDGQYAPEAMPNLMWPVLFEGHEVVFGSRMLKKKDALDGGMPFYKFMGNIVLTTFENLILSTKMSEFHSGYRLYGTSVLSVIPFELNTDDFHFDTQIIIQCSALGVKIHEVPIPTYYGDEICYVDGVKYAKDVALEVLAFRMHQIHFIRQSRYIIEAGETYILKKSRYSSHQQIARLVEPDSTVLDVGCGTGFLANLLAKKGADVWGIDMVDASRVTESVSHFIQHDLEDVSDLELDRTFDYLILGDVIEHIRNAVDGLSGLDRFLKEDGRLIISTGNIAIWFYRLSLLLGRFKYGSRGILDETHVKLYTLSTFRELVERAGFKILSVRPTPIPFELVFSSRGKSTIPKVIEFVYMLLCRVWKRMFAYQFIIEAQISALDFIHGEGEITPDGETGASKGAHES